MSNSFTPVTPDFLVSRQIKPSDVAAAAQAGVTLIINNRPDGEAPGQPRGSDIEAAAHEAGLAYVDIPIDQRGLTPAHREAFQTAIAKSNGKALGFCRTGTRSIFLWAHASASSGVAVDEIISAAAKAGYDIASQAPALRALGAAEK